MENGDSGLGGENLGQRLRSAAVNKKSSCFEKLL